MKPVHYQQKQIAAIAARYVRAVVLVAQAHVRLFVFLAQSQLLNAFDNVSVKLGDIGVRYVFEQLAHLEVDIVVNYLVRVHVYSDVEPAREQVEKRIDARGHVRFEKRREVVLAADKIERRNIINCVGFFYIEQVFVVLAVARRAAVFVPLVIELDELERFLFAVPLQHALDILLGHYAV